jgi:hypothetical protein
LEGGCLRFYILLKHFSLLWRRHHYRWRAAKFRPMLGAQDLWAARDLYRATPVVTRDLDYSGLIRRTAPFSSLLRLIRGCGGSILTRILTGTAKGGSQMMLLKSALYNDEKSVESVSGINLYLNCSIWLVTQNLIGSFDFGEVFYIVYCNLPWRHNAV